jgi:hypothetical protein
MIRLKRKSQLSPNIVPKNFHSSYTQKSSGLNITFFGKRDKAPGKVLQGRIDLWRISIFIRDEINKIGLLPFHISLKDLSEIGDLTERAGNDKPDLLPGKGRRMGIEKAPVKK